MKYNFTRQNGLVIRKNVERYDWKGYIFEKEVNLDHYLQINFKKTLNNVVVMMIKIV